MRIRVTCTRALACLFALVLTLPAETVAQRIRGVPEDLMLQVMPDADSFVEWGADPTVMQAFRVDPASGDQNLLGYVFHTADVPPERRGYSGPIGTVVGLGLDGRITGMRITDYRESMRSSRGDFLRPRGFQEQFVDKHVGDAFRPFSDVESISRATVSVRALSLGMRNAARRVADTYFGVEPETPGVIEDVDALSWLELRRAGVVKLMTVESDIGSAEISLVHLVDDAFGERLVGTAAMGSVNRARASSGGGHVFAYGVDGLRLRYFSRKGWLVAQDGDTIETPEDQVLPFGLAAGGLLYDQVPLTGMMVLDPSIDITRPFEILFDLRPNLDLFAVEYLTLEARRVLAAEALVASAERSTRAAEAAELRAAAAAEVQPADNRASETASADGAGAVAGAGASVTAPGAGGPGVGPTTDGSADLSELEPRAETATLDAPELTASAEVPTAALGSPTTAQGFDPLDFQYAEDETILARVFERTQAKRLGATAVVLLLATLAFFMKNRSIRAVTLGVTLVFLGWIDGGFLSVSHITSGIWRGPSVYFDDLALLLMVTFTVIATVLFGRVFCGFLCPFGALQDLLDNIVPARFRKRVPRAVHDRALWLKYAVLAGILIPAIAGSHASLYQYAEPFGTVFFPSKSVFLWGIALSFLAASAVVPRFYCRYVCPLGAALAIGSLVSINRIRRVEHCAHCKVCEQACPTGAIRGNVVDFKECVRCNVCETKLIEKSGVCRHDMEKIRPRLVQIRVSATAGATYV